MEFIDHVLMFLLFLFIIYEMSAELCNHVVMYLVFVCSNFPISIFGVIHNVAEPTTSTACHLITDMATVECANVTESVAFIITVSKICIYSPFCMWILHAPRTPCFPPQT